MSDETMRRSSVGVRMASRMAPGMALTERRQEDGSHGLDLTFWAYLGLDWLMNRYE